MHGQACSILPPGVEASVVGLTRKVRFPLTFPTTKYSRGILSPINEVETYIWSHRKHHIVQVARPCDHELDTRFLVIR